MKALVIILAALGAALMAAATVAYLTHDREREYAWPCPPEDDDGVLPFDPRTASTGLAG